MNYQTRLASAVRQFWQTRARQDARQGQTTGERDAGNRAAVTGGKHLDGFVQLVQDVLMEGGLSRVAVHTRKRDVVLPGFFRPTKEWDLIAVHDKRLLAIVEFKSQVGSFGNNFNNRVEEALGNATDLHTAYREGAFKPSPAPWIGYFMLLQQVPKSTEPVRVKEPHFPVLRTWRGTPSYAKRYELFLSTIGARAPVRCGLLPVIRGRTRPGWVVLRAVGRTDLPVLRSVVEGSRRCARPARLTQHIQDD